MNRMKGKTVLITGGAAGIGLCTAENFAKAGCHVILTDINENALASAKDVLTALGATVETYVENVADRRQVEAVAAKVLRAHGALDILINNAGIGHLGELANTTLETWEKLLAVNLWGPLYHIYAFLPAMIEKRAGQIVNVSSGQAFFQLPTWGAYAAIKTCVGVFSEILHWELRKYDIDVTTVYPYMVNTGFYNDVKADTLGAKLSMKLLPYYSQTPEKVGKIIFKATKRRTRVEMVNVINNVGYAARMMVPPIGNGISLITNLMMAKDADASPEKHAGA